MNEIAKWHSGAVVYNSRYNEISNEKSGPAEKPKKSD